MKVKSKVDLIKTFHLTLHQEVKERIEEQNFKVASRINKGWKEVFFNPVFSQGAIPISKENKVPSKMG